MAPVHLAGERKNLMKVNFGKHTGKSVESLILKEPGYINWALGNRDASGALLSVKREAERLIAIFDQKPFSVKCFGCRKNISSRISLYSGGVSVFCWCDNCDPYSQGAFDGRLSIVKTYKHILQHVELTCDNSNDSFKTIVRAVAELKGLPKRVGEKQAREFFA